MAGLNQVRGHAVVTSFVHCNRSSGEHHLLPPLLINSVDIAVAFYDAEYDVLMHVLPLKWREKRSVHKASVCFLWMVLYHQLFLRPLSEE